LVLRRQVALRYREQVLNDPVRQALGRSGKSLGGGEDGDMGLCGFDLGFGTGKFPQLELIHLISASRLNLDYLAGIHEGFGYSGGVMRAVYQPDLPPLKNPFGPLRILLLRIKMLLSGKNRVERRILLAMENGRLRAQSDLKRLGYRRPPQGA
jgi:hypothetical protein